MTAKNRIPRLKNGIFVKNMGVKGLILTNPPSLNFFKTIYLFKGPLMYILAPLLGRIMAS